MKVENGTPLHRLRSLLGEGAGLILHPHAGDVLDVAALASDPDDVVSGLAALAHARIEKAERIGVPIPVKRAALAHLVDAAMNPTAPTSDDGDGDAPNLKRLTVAELRVYAADRGIDLHDATTKAEIIAAITAAQ